MATGLAKLKLGLRDIFDSLLDLVDLQRKPESFTSTGTGKDSAPKETRSEKEKQTALKMKLAVKIAKTTFNDENLPIPEKHTPGHDQSEAMNKVAIALLAKEIYKQL